MRTVARLRIHVLQATIVAGIGGLLAWANVPPTVLGVAMLILAGLTVVTAAVAQAPFPGEGLSALEAVEQRRMMLLDTSISRICRRLDMLAFFVPRELREPFWNHVLDDVEKMRADGWSGTRITIAVWSQVVILVLTTIKEALLNLPDRTLRRR